MTFFKTVAFLHMKNRQRISRSSHNLSVLYEMRLSLFAGTSLSIVEESRCGVIFETVLFLDMAKNLYPFIC